MKVLVAATCRPDDRISLCIIRSLAAVGVEVCIGGDRFAGRAFSSRYIDKKLRYPNPAVDPQAFLESFLRLAEKERFDVILPTSDYIVSMLAGEQSKIEKLAGLPVPHKKALNLFRDKFQTIRLASDLGIHTPETHCCENLQELPPLLASLEYPLIVKPRRSTGGIGLFQLEKPADLPAEFFQTSITSDHVFDFQRPLVQEYIAGSIHDVCLLFNRGEPRVVLTQKRLKMYPSIGGGGIYNVTTDEPDLKEQAIALLKAAQWHGPAQVEFKRTPEGRPYLMEVNGRFWGTLDLAVTAGINFPLLACRMAVEGDIEPVDSYKVGLQFRWPVPYGLLHAAETRTWIRTLWEFFGPRRGVHSDLTASDPLPMIAEILFALSRMGSRRRIPIAADSTLQRMHSVSERRNH